jgi:hypothetical protein
MCYADVGIRPSDCSQFPSVVVFDPHCPVRILTPSLRGFDCESQPNSLGDGD